jgi:surface protein
MLVEFIDSVPNLNLIFKPSVIDMSYMFNNATSFNQEIGNWNVSKVTDMSYMFNGASIFTNGGAISMSGWSTSAVTNMQSMFNQAIVFAQDISFWDVSNVTNMTNMLDNCNMSTQTYNVLLRRWRLLPTLENNVTFGVSGLTYDLGSQADIARTFIITNYNWTFVGDAKS